MEKKECDCSNIRVETIKEFAERLKGLSRFLNSDRFWIDNLVKEMVGE